MKAVRNQPASPEQTSTAPARSAAIPEQPILRRAGPTTRRAPSLISEGLRSAIRAFAERSVRQAASPQSDGVEGMFGQAVNAGIHDLGERFGGVGQAIASAMQNPLGALQGLGGQLGNLASSPLGALQGLGGQLGDLASNPLGAVQSVLGGAGSELGNLASNPLGALQGALGNDTAAAETPAPANDTTETAPNDAATPAAPDSAGTRAGTPPALAPLRASLAPDLQSELDRLCATPEGLAAVQSELQGGRPPTAAPAAPVAPVARHGGGDIADHAEEALATATASPSSALPGGLRGRFEAATGADLSGVRVHSDASAAAAAAALGAHAFAQGQDVYFGTGQYRPGTTDGDHLIAHEVAHTIQQRGAPSAPQFRLEVSEPGDALEDDADRIADRMLGGAP